MTPLTHWPHERLRCGLHALILMLCLAGVPALAACGDDDAASAERHPTAKEGSGGEAVHEERDAVTLDTAAIRLGGIRVGSAEAIASTALPVTGTITYDANLVSHIGARTEGRVISVRADLGTRVRRGQVLLELESPDVGQIRAQEQEAHALLKISRENYERERRLEAQGISSRRELLEAEAEMRRAEAAQRSASVRLGVLGAGHGSGGHFDLLAPFAGVVVAREVSLGEMASPNDTLLTVADLSRVWIELDVFERDLARVEVGQHVSLTTTAYPSRTFPGRIVYVGDVLDPVKRTVRARVEIPNADGALKPGMFATAAIQIGAGGTPGVVVPQEAVQEVEGKPVVFVPGDAPGEFRAVPVKVGDAVDGKHVVIRSGIAPGARLVVAGAFALRSELAKGEIGESGH